MCKGAVRRGVYGDRLILHSLEETDKRVSDCEKSLKDQTKMIEELKQQDSIIKALLDSKLTNASRRLEALENGEFVTVENLAELKTDINDIVEVLELHRSQITFLDTNRAQQTLDEALVRMQALSLRCK